jgi:hypothetical protein
MKSAHQHTYATRRRRNSLLRDRQLVPARSDNWLAGGQCQDKTPYPRPRVRTRASKLSPHRPAASTAVGHASHSRLALPRTGERDAALHAQRLAAGRRGSERNVSRIRGYVVKLGVRQRRAPERAERVGCCIRTGTDLLRVCQVYPGLLFALCVIDPSCLRSVEDSALRSIHGSFSFCALPSHTSRLASHPAYGCLLHRNQSNVCSDCSIRWDTSPPWFPGNPRYGFPA